MIREINLEIRPQFIFNNEHIKKTAASAINVNPAEITALQVMRRSIDARRKPVYRLKVIAFINEQPISEKPVFQFKNVSKAEKVIIVGSGPAGLFAALRLLELGLQPVIVERGKDVRSRRRDLKAIQREHIVDPDSNYCFGEGGAGAYSDGKLYTRSKKRGSVNRILNLLHYHGAADDILIDSHPHIGSNNLPKIIQKIRETILGGGGQILFNKRVTDLLIKDGKIAGVVANNDEEIPGRAVILAVGHSARDIFYMLRDKGVSLEAKPFAMGVRVEHPQSLIDSIQYHTKNRHLNLPASSYNLACEVDKKGVYSFCMCPGGIIIPASTAPGELVLNGMSVSKRNSPFANAGLVVSITKEDWIDYKEHGSLAGLEYQKSLEKLAFEIGGCTQSAPAQRITDFTSGILSSSLPKSSYIPGTVSAPLHELLPKNITDRLKKGLFQFGKKMHGYFTEEAQILAAETRTSSPVRIPREPLNKMNPQIEGLFPSGEGAGYAGGIVSAAIDGEKCAEGVCNYLRVG